MWQEESSMNQKEGNCKGEETDMGEEETRDPTWEEADGAGAAKCCCRTKSRPEKEQKDLINRLSRIEGQIRGLKGMVERDAYCIDIINQAAAASSALASFSKVLLTSHIRTCVAEDVRGGNDEKVDELVKTLQKLLR